jgi:endonuclease-3 related protein
MRRRLKSVYRRLQLRYGPQHWWPGDTPFEIMVGAILTQNTAWSNVEQAIGNLTRHGRLDPERLLALREERLAEWLRPSGYFNVKARRLKAFCRWYVDHGGYPALREWDTARLRGALLKINGVGPETADDILLYAFARPVFVIDAYTRRLFARLGLATGTEGYEPLRALIETELRADAVLYNEYHALIVRHAKAVCRSRPRCTLCVLRRTCPAGGVAQERRPATSRMRAGRT